MGNVGGGWVGGVKAEDVGVSEGVECPLPEAGCRGLAEEMGGRTGTPSPGRLMAGWPCGRVASKLLALWEWRRKT